MAINIILINKEQMPKVLLTYKYYFTVFLSFGYYTLKWKVGQDALDLFF